MGHGRANEMPMKCQWNANVVAMLLQCCCCCRRLPPLINQSIHSLLNIRKVRVSGKAGQSIDVEFVSDGPEAGGSGRGFRATYRLLPCGQGPTTWAPYTTPPGVTCGNYIVFLFFRFSLPFPGFCRCCCCLHLWDIFENIWDRFVRRQSYDSEEWPCAPSSAGCRNCVPFHSVLQRIPPVVDRHGRMNHSKPIVMLQTGTLTRRRAS